MSPGARGQTNVPAPQLRPAITDTSVLIRFFRYGEHQDELALAVRASRLHLSSLVALELYMGTRDQQEKRALDHFTASFERRGLLVAPRHEDYVLGGILLGRRRRQVGDLLAKDHLADVMIVLSASQIAGTVITDNVKHLEVWASLARRAGRDVRVRGPASL